MGAPVRYEIFETACGINSIKNMAVFSAVVKNIFCCVVNDNDYVFIFIAGC